MLISKTYQVLRKNIVAFKKSKNGGIYAI